MNKLLDSAELGRPESKNPAELQRTDDLVLPRYCFLPTRTRESTSANVNNSVLAKKSTKELNVWAEPKLRHLECLQATNNHQGGLWDSEDEAAAKIISVPDSEISQQSAPHIQLELSKIIWTGTTSVTCCSKFSAVFLQLQCAICTIITLFDDANFLTKDEYPSFGRRSLNYTLL